MNSARRSLRALRLSRGSSSFSLPLNSTSATSATLPSIIFTTCTQPHCGAIVLHVCLCFGMAATVQRGLDAQEPC